jgi:hypothetical protein
MSHGPPRSAGLLQRQRVGHPGFTVGAAAGPLSQTLVYHAKKKKKKTNPSRPCIYLGEGMGTEAPTAAADLSPQQLLIFAGHRLPLFLGVQRQWCYGLWLSRRFRLFKFFEILFY